MTEIQNEWTVWSDSDASDDASGATSTDNINQNADTVQYVAGGDEITSTSANTVTGKEFQTRLVLEDEDAPADISTPYQIVEMGQFDGEISDANDVDYVAIELIAGVRYEIVVPSNVLSNGTLQTPNIDGVFDQNGTSVSNGDSGSGLRQSAELFFAPTETGTYYIAVSSGSSAIGTYSLHVRELGVTSFGDIASDTTSGATVEVGGLYEGIIGEQGDEDAIAVTLEAGVTYQIDALGDDARDGYTLADPLLGTILDSNGGSASGTILTGTGIGTDDRLFFTPESSGTYFIVVGGDANTVGRFGLFVTPTENLAVSTSDDITGGQAGARELLLGGEATGVINTVNDTDLFSIELEAGQSVIVEMPRGGDGETRVLNDPEILAVTGPDGQPLTNVYDADGGLDFNPKVRFTAEESGTYVVEVAGSVGLTGSYKLTAVETEGFSGNGLPFGPSNPETFPRIEQIASPSDPLLAPMVWIGKYLQVGPEGDPIDITFSFLNADSEFGPRAFQDANTPAQNSFWFELNDAEKAITRDALDQISDFSDVVFTELAEAPDSAGTIRLGWSSAPNPAGGAFANLQNGSRVGGDVWFIADNLARPAEVEGTFLHYSILHEMAHAIGLTHPFDDGTPGKPVIAEEFNSMRYTVMSYTETQDFPVTGFANADLYPSTYMYLDILALQAIYGAKDTNTGDNVYAYDGSERHYLTLWDNGGNDTLRVTNTTADLKLSLVEHTWSNVGTTITYFLSTGGTATEQDTIFIPEGIVIENAFGASGDDQIFGNAVSNRLIGQAGNDSVFGGAGNDTAFAGGADDGNDLVIGGNGHDLIGGGAGADRLFGDAAISSSGAFISENGGSSSDLGSDTIFGGSADDTIVGSTWSDTDNDGVVEASEVVSTDSRNVLWSGSGDDLAFGGSGADEIGGGSGNDTLHGGNGADVFYGGKETDLDGTNDQIFAGGGNDTVFAGAGDDMIDGGNAADVLFGGAGNDTIDGGAVGDSIFGGGGDDVLTGGGGVDTFFFAVGAGTDQITDFSVEQDILTLTNATTDFTSVEDVIAASEASTVNDVDGVLIDLGGGDTLFLAGLSVDDLTNLSAVF